MPHPLAGKPAPESIIVDLKRLERAYFVESQSLEPVVFGTSGHRGSSLRRSFNEAHILAIAQAICEYRVANKIDGPIFIGSDTHHLSSFAERTVLEVLAANRVNVFYSKDGIPTPTPVVSRSILAFNANISGHHADGIIITPSHNPPEDGGIKYNPPNGGPADTDVTSWIEKRANELLTNAHRDVRRVTYYEALHTEHVLPFDFIDPYVCALGSVVDMQSIANAKLRIGIDPLGGSNLHYWSRIADQYGLDITVVNTSSDPTFRFMPVDHDGKIRMDCSSPYAMANLVRMKDDFDIACGNDADSDRHGIVTKSRGLLNPNHFLAVAISHLFGRRSDWSREAGVGKTLVSSSLIDRVCQKLGRRVVEVPVGFKWFVDGLISGSIAFGGEESAGASFCRKDGTVWTTDKDGIIMDLLAAEILAVTGKDPGTQYESLIAEHGEPFYTRIDAPATPAVKAKLKKLNAQSVQATTLAGDPITAKLTHARGNGAAIGGLKVTTDFGWFAARPSGTEDVAKVYAESFRSPEHLAKILEEAQAIVASV